MNKLVNALATSTGPPLSPMPVLQKVNDTTVRVSWEEPFTWKEFPILTYTVLGINCSSDAVIVNTTTTAKQITFTQSEGITRSCSVLQFEVKAATAVGESIPISLLWPILISEFCYFYPQHYYQTVDFVDGCTEVIT